VLDLCGKISVNESAAIISRCAAIITHDTGMMHIAAAFGKEILSIWGNTVPALGMTPYLGKKGGRGDRFEVKGLGCRPCSKIGFGECPKGHFKCMNEQDIPAIVERLAES
jgi:heptosyltransferase-2